MTKTRKLILAGAVVVWLVLLYGVVIFWGLKHFASPSVATAPPAPAAVNTNGVTLELETFFNAQLDLPWNPTSYAGDDLAELPRGVQEFGGVRFHVRGVIQLQGGEWKRRGLKYPEKVEGIPIQRACRSLYLLHADGGAPAPVGTTVATLVLHYQDGTSAEIPIQHGVHLNDWWSYGRPPPSDPNTVVAWTGQNQATAQKGNSIRLYMTRFDNPQPTKTVVSLDYISAMAAPGPFLVALTVD
jgi:hypothetical protein